MSELILFVCIFSITCGYMNIGNIIQNKKLINYGLLTLFIWFAMFICHKIFAQLINYKK